MTLLSLWRGEIYRPRRLMRDILAEVAERTGVGADDMKGASRHRPINAARMEAMYLMRMAGRSVTEVGAFLNRDHSTISVDVRRYCTRLGLEPPMSTLLSHAYDSQFAAFWEIYPRKTAKGFSRKCFERALTRTDYESLMTAARDFAESVASCEKRFIPHASTWLNQGRWADAIEDVRAVYARQPTPNQQRLADHGESLQRMLAGALAAVDGEGVGQGHRAPDSGEPRSNL